MFNFDFLKNTTLNKVESDVRITGKTGGRKATPKVPDNGASLRLFKDGSIYPSLEAVGKYDLEYAGNSGNGFDVIDSRVWSQYPQDATPVLFIAAVPKKSGLVDLFASAKEEKTSVLTQGSKTFGPELQVMIEGVYGVQLFENGEKYVDLVIVEDVELPALDGIYNVPKMITKGENKGQMTTKRRENITVNPLALFVPNEEQQPSNGTENFDDANDEALAVLEEVEEEIA